jgi:hypothetical protein
VQSIVGGSLGEAQVWLQTSPPQFIEAPAQTDVSFEQVCEQIPVEQVIAAFSQALAPLQVTSQA